jgi:hypothetical protein
VLPHGYGAVSRNKPGQHSASASWLLRATAVRTGCLDGDACDSLLRGRTPGPLARALELLEAGLRIHVVVALSFRLCGCARACGPAVAQTISAGLKRCAEQALPLPGFRTASSCLVAQAGGISANGTRSRSHRPL